MTDYADAFASDIIDILADEPNDLRDALKEYWENEISGTIDWA